MESVKASPTLLTIHSGNLLSLNPLKRRPSLSGADELLDSLSYLLEKCTEVDQDQNHLRISCRNRSILTEDERKDTQVSVKVFLCCPTEEGDGVKDSLETSMDLLGLEFVESVIVSMPANREDADEKLKACWKQLESLVLANRILTIGCSDISTQQLKELCAWAEVKPSTVQINLASCCVVPPEMTEFATQHDIRLLTHNDPQEILTNDSLRVLLAKNESIPSQQKWSIDWILRYAITIKGRGVIREKGYVLKASANE